MNLGNISDAGRARAKSADVHSGLSSSGRDASSTFLAILFHLSAVRLTKADDPQIFATRRDPAGVQPPLHEGQHLQAGLAVVPARVLRDQSGLPFEPLSQ